MELWSKGSDMKQQLVCIVVLDQLATRKCIQLSASPFAAT
jgi:hypothetical protein